MRRTDEALWTYEKVMEGLEQMGLKGTRNYASALINLGNVHIARKSYEKAYGIDRQALEILERLGGISEIRVIQQYERRPAGAWQDEGGAGYGA